MLAKKGKKQEMPKSLTSFRNLDLLMKLRIVIFSMFGLSTLGLVIIFAGNWAVAAFLILLAYLMLIILSVKLLLVKKL